MPQKNDSMTFDEAKGRLLDALLEHVGKENAVGADVLHQKVFGEKVLHKENDTKKLRTLVKACRRQGKRIGSICSTAGGGYYIIRSMSEFNEYGARTYVRPALKKLEEWARMKGITLPELMGQMVINFGENKDGK